MKILTALIDLNFKFSVFLSIAGGILVYQRPDLFFDQDFRLFGPIANNILIAAVLIAIIQGLLAYRYFRNGYREALGMGFLFVLIGYDLQTYSDINQIYVDPVLSYCSFYLAAAHILYFLITPEAQPDVEKKNRDS